MRVFVTTPAVKSGSTVLSWLLSRHSLFNHSPIQENIELGAMLNVLDHIPGWIRKLGPNGQAAGKPEMLAKIRAFTDLVMNPNGHEFSAIKFTNFGSYNWLSHVFPDDKILLIVRNPYDWYASIKIWNTTRHGGWSMASVDRWMMSAVHSLTRENNDGIRIVHFEDLVEDTNATMAAVHEYLGITPEPVDVSGQEEIFQSFSSRPGSYDLPTYRDGNMLSRSPIGRGSELTKEERDHVSGIMESPLVRKSLYSDEKRLYRRVI